MPLEPFFSILDGALNYDCSLCQATCCRGGYGTAVMHGDEWSNLKKKYPLLPHFAIDQGKYIYLINHKPKCFFLTKQHLCRLEQKNGRIEKPLQCKIFPYQVCGRIQDRHLIRVGLLCPFTIDANLQGNIRSENFYREIGDVPVKKIYDVFDVELSSYLPDPLSVEQKIIEVSKEYFQQKDFKGFLFAQLAISCSTLRARGLIDEQRGLSSQQIMKNIISQQCQFLGLDLEELDQKNISRFMISLSPILRSLMLEKHPYFQVGYLLALYLYSLVSQQIQNELNSSFTIQAIVGINLQLSGKLEYLGSFPFVMTPKYDSNRIKHKVKNLFKTSPHLNDTAIACQNFVEDLLQGETLGSASCRHFKNLCGFSKNQAIEYYIHHLAPFFIKALP